MKKAVLIIFIFLGGFCYSQNHYGTAIYKVKRAFKPLSDSLNLDKEMSAILNKSKSNWEKGISLISFELNFNKKESIFQLQKKIYANQKSKMLADLGSLFVTHPVYTDLDKKEVVKQKKVGGDLFLIEDSLPNTKWTLHNDTKTIGKYICYKATTKVVNYYSGKAREDLVIAWYAPEITVPFGPENYNGLPGLIIEVSVAQKTIYLTKINFNKIIKIKPLKKGIVTTEKKLRSLRKKIMNERLGRN